MAISGSDILWKHSVKTGSAGNSTAGTAAGSLGKYISTTAWAGGVAHDLFDVVTGAENAASTVDYRCVFIHNSHASLALLSAMLWLTSPVSGGADFAIAVDTTVASVIGSSSAQAVEIANETTVPSGLTFSAPTTKAGGLSLGDIPAGQCRAVWIRRTAANTAALNNDGVTLNVEGDTAA